MEVDGDVLRIELDDCSDDLPGAAADPGEGAESGRGLLLVAELATSWGAHAVPGGKRVWFEVACEPVDADPATDRQRSSASTGTSGGSKPSTWP